MGVEVVVTNLDTVDFSAKDACGMLFQYPDTEGAINDYHDLIEKCHDGGVSCLLSSNEAKVICSSIIEATFVRMLPHSYKHTK